MAQENTEHTGVAASRAAVVLAAGGALSERLEDLGVVEVAGEQELSGLLDFLFGEREEPVVALALMSGAQVTVLAPRAVRAIIGPGRRVYVRLAAIGMGCVGSGVG